MQGFEFAVLSRGWPVLVRPPDRISYRSLTDLDCAVRSVASQSPRDVRLIVGIPRSGMPAATMPALHVNLPLADLDDFLGGRTLVTAAMGFSP